MIYQVHQKNQQEKLILIGRELLITSGYEKFSISSVAKKAKVTRTTVYKFFGDKDILLWKIQKHQLNRLGELMQSKLSTIEDTGLNRFIVFLESLADIFVENKHFFLFFSHFNKIYQAETIGETSDNYQKIFKKK